MLIKYLSFITNQSNLLTLFLLLILQSCSHKKESSDKKFQESTPDDYFTKVHKTKCESNQKVYESLGFQRIGYYGMYFGQLN